MGSKETSRSGSTCCVDSTLLDMCRVPKNDKIRKDHIRGDLQMTPIKRKEKKSNVI